MLARSPRLSIFAILFASALSTFSTAESVDEIASRFQREQGLPGLVVASVAQSKTRGLLAWTGAYGQANIANNETMTTDTSLWLASLTKAVVGTLMTKAKEEGHLTYESRASEILREASSFVLGDPETMPWLEDVKLEHLATHRSTIRDDTATYMCGYYVGEPSPGEHSLLLDLFGMENTCIENSPVSLDGFLAAYLSVEGPYYNATNNFLPGVEPGEQTEYSNIAAGLAGYLIGLASNTSLPEYSSKEVFEVLGMKNTSFLHSDLAKVATPYTKLDGALDDYTEMPIYDLATFPDGGLRSSVNDMTLFLGTIMNHGSLDRIVRADDETATAKTETREKNVLLEPDSVEDMLRPRYGDDHGIFWFITSLEVGGKKRNLIGHNGGDPGAFTYMFFDPDTATGYFIAGNGDGEALDPVALANLTAALFAHADEMVLEGTHDKPAVDDSDSPSDDAETEMLADSEDAPVSGASARASIVTAVSAASLLGLLSGF